MVFSEEISDLIGIVLVGILIFFLLLDEGLIFLIKKHKSSLRNKYYDFHLKHGFMKISMAKLIVALIIIYFILTNQPSSGALSAPIFVHAVYVTKLLIDYVKTKDSDPGTRHS